MGILILYFSCYNSKHANMTLSPAPSTSVYISSLMTSITFVLSFKFIQLKGYFTLKNTLSFHRLIRLLGTPRTAFEFLHSVFRYLIFISPFQDLPIQTHYNFKLHFNHDRFNENNCPFFWWLLTPSEYVSRPCFLFIKCFIYSY